MKRFILLMFLMSAIRIAVALPVKEKGEEEKKSEEESEQHSADVADSIEYERYLKEVVNILETDPEFRKKIDNATDVDIRSGKIAHELEHVNHHVRSKLDEIKRREIERLRLLAMKQYELTNDIDRDHLKIADPRHLDHENPHTFEIEDLKKLILKTSEDLAKADQKRREEFKEYELQKEFEKREKMREMDEEHRKKFEEELRQQQAKHSKHEPLHHPGNKAQLEEVWEKQDHMDPADFKPETFFMVHDVDGNGYWDQTEVKALFVKELDKVYKSGLPEDDMRERVEEMERMREHVFQEADTNHDNLISKDEFIAQTKREEFNRDPNWETVDNQPQFTHDEYLEFERRRREEIDRLIAQGLLPPHPNMPYGYHPGQDGQYQHPNAVPHQGYQQQGYQHGYQQNGNQQQGHQQGYQQQGYQQQGYQQQGYQQQGYQQQGYQHYQQPPNVQIQHPNAQPRDHPQQQVNVQYQQAPPGQPIQTNQQATLRSSSGVPNPQEQNNKNQAKPVQEIPNSMNAPNSINLNDKH